MSNDSRTHSSLHIILEGRIFEEQALGGISRIYHETLPRICDMEEQLTFTIVSSGSLLQPLPEHPRITSQISSVPVQSLRPQTLFWQLQDYLRAKFEIRSVPHDKNILWHATYFRLPPAWKGPKLTTVYDLIPEQFPEFFNRNFDRIFKHRKQRAILAADKVICISNSVRIEVMEMFRLPPERVVTVPLACGDSFRTLRKDDIPADYRIGRPFILYVGMREGYKNFTTLVDAYAAWSRRDEVTLLAVGSRWSPEEQRHIRATGVESNIFYKSGVNDEELCSLYNQALAFVYPSLSEGFGIPLLEAMACGCPVAASRIPVFVEVAGDAPYFFNPLDKDELIAALEAACYSRKVDLEREDILSRYSWERTARATLDIYRDMVHCD